jgi:hypothetical protein
MGKRCDTTYSTFLRKTFRCGILPGFLTTFCHIDRAGICSYPNYHLFQKRFIDFVDGTVIFFPPDIPSDGRTGNDLFIEIEGSQIWYNDLPYLPIVGGFM